MDHNYDKTDKYSIEKYGQGMVGKTFRELCELDDTDELISESEEAYKEGHGDVRRKGGLGELVEERYFHYKANNESAPDFEEAGVELKTSPYRINKNKSLSAKERLVLNMIDYNEVINETDFDSSHFWYKSNLILLVYYLWKKGVDKLDYRIDYVRLFTPSEDDLVIIKNDYEKIIKKIRDGKAHELSESDTLYLSACTKSGDSSVVRSQPNSDIPAKPRAFSFKSSYMTYVLRNRILEDKPQYEKIYDANVGISFEKYTIQKIEQYKGRSFIDLVKEFGLEKSLQKKAKNIYSMLTLRMLGAKGKKIEEFEKANVVIKTIRLNKKGKMDENISFPRIVFNKIICEEWEESEIYETLYSKRFLFVVFKEDSNGSKILEKAFFWNMPYTDLNNHVKLVWEKTKRIIKEGFNIQVVKNKYVSPFPKESDDDVCHVRPHGRNNKDVDTLPNGKKYPKQCFWLNKNYILLFATKEN